MNFPEYKKLIKTIVLGKRLPTAIYLHTSAMNEALPEELNNLLRGFAAKKADKWNILKIFTRDFKVSFLHYPDFDSYAYPQLHTSITIDLETSNRKTTDYSKSENPPILHRKELYVSESYPVIDTFRQQTVSGEKYGLYANTSIIGFKQNWERLLKRKCLQLDTDGNITPTAAEVKPAEISKENASVNTEVVVHRHLTAINRDKLSAPFQKLAKFGYLDGSFSLFDYGCGKGDDATELQAHGLNINAWDPQYAPDKTKLNADIVNLGFVLNVIEDYQERCQALKSAYGLANELLVVSVMLLNDNKQERFKPYKDGVLTSWNTFQKYYTQAQISQFIGEQLGVTTVSIGQGIIAVFKNKELEELHHSQLQFHSFNWKHLTKRQPTLRPTSQRQIKLTKHKELFDSFWLTCLELGRVPANDEFELSDEIRRIANSHNNAFKMFVCEDDLSDFNKAKQQRLDDLLVYFALSLFGKRKAKSHLPARVRRDIKVHFENLQACIDKAEELLFSVNQPANLAKSCEGAYKQFDIGEFEDSNYYIFPRNLLNQFPSILRVYVGCAVQLYGDIDDIDLIKIHIRSAKVTLLKYDDFNKPLPLLTERVKIRLRDLDVDFFIYGDKYPYQPLYNKSAFMNKSQQKSKLKTQQKLERQISQLLVDVPRTEWPDWDLLLKVFAYKKLLFKESRLITFDV